MITTDSKYQRAVTRLEEVKKFYRTLTSYILVVGFLAILNYADDQWREMWFLWVALGWGLGLIFYALKVFRIKLFFSREWEERRIRRYMKEEEEIVRKL